MAGGSTNVSISARLFGTAAAGDVKQGLTFSHDGRTLETGTLNLTNLRPENIRRGVNIAGIVGAVRLLDINDEGSGPNVLLDSKNGTAELVETKTLTMQTAGAVRVTIETKDGLSLYWKLVRNGVPNPIQYLNPNTTYNFRVPVADGDQIKVVAGTNHPGGDYNFQITVTCRIPTICTAQ